METETVHDRITEHMIAFLEQGIVPWHTSWANGGPPINLMSRMPYRGINVLFLAAQGYERNIFLTQRQVDRLGASVREGEKPHLVIDGIGFRTLNPYQVYNIGQCENISPVLIPEMHPKSHPVEVCREVIGQMHQCPRVVHGHPKPIYFHRTDAIYMPEADSFGSQQDYLAAFFKPLISSCKHENRLDWTDLAEYAKFDPAAKTQEELVVEIGLFFLTSFTGLAVKQGYDQDTIQHWIGRFREIPTLAYVASLMAQEAFSYITGISFSQNEASQFLEDDRLPY